MLDYSTFDNLVRIVEESIEASKLEQSKIPNEVAMLRGMSSPKIRHFLNRLCSYGPCKYLEIGVWAGSTLIPALWENKVAAKAIDNWSQFLPEECGGFNAREELNSRLERYKNNLGSYDIYNQDCLSPDCQLSFGFWPNVFFYDGNHDEPSTAKAIEKFGRFCARPFILVVDDWELVDTVKLGTFKGVAQLQSFGEGMGSHNTWHLKKSDGYHEGVFVTIIA